MAQLPMCPPMPGSPQTTTTDILLAAGLSVAVSNLSCFPPIGSELMNLVTLQNGQEVWETCPYTAKSAETGAGHLTLARSGLGWASSTGAPQEWAVGSKLSRTNTAYDNEAFRANISDHEGRIASQASEIVGFDTRLDTAEGEIDTLQTNVGTLQADVVALQSSAGMDPIVAALIFG